ncbi:hypothetical protein QJS10_CPB13g00183 [Acorus calamus]|uniref:DUF7798 domain-containing protein n=1 Tax=Acorus calamus TaxID=4465 RepID=A0AAV9DG17_ACOCL|nr:hypothetical protein QJS10_CPB13g00183 [Acorus calamus]
MEGDPTASGEKTEEAPPAPATRGSGGWGGWGISSLSVFSDLQKAAEEISRNAVAAAKNAVKEIADIQNVAPDSETVDEEKEASGNSGDEGKPEDETDKMRKSALDKLEKASEDTLLGQARIVNIYCHLQGLKVIDNSVETLASGAWQALGSAWKGSSNLVNRLENSAASLAESIQHGNLPVPAGSLAPSILETGKTFTTKGIQVLERVGKETMELLIQETGFEVEKDSKEADRQADEEQFLEEVTFDRCFYIYGGPDQLEELEALSNHYALLFNRRKSKLLSEQKSLYDGKLKQVQQIFSLGAEIEGSGADPDKGKNVESVEEESGNEIKIMRDSSVSKAADMAAGFTAALGGIATNEIIQRTADRLETIHSEGVHRLSELCCFAVSQLLMLGKSVISSANKSQNEDTEEESLKITWPEDSVLKARIIRSKAQSMSGDVEAVSNGFITGISDVSEACLAAIKDAAADGQSSIQEKAHAISNHLRADQTTALDKIQDALLYLAYVVISTSMPTPTTA